ncbi:uncharacterized protein K02A2.6-like [Achroia grisella]|uniref:uncharacterized protein K02A2.6-like n=1 Tax=Achroia grisella TaxID=688607 RepID=UPI0027D326C6|nr:uncharacterized protein K02A2.6-like [Achroia grisella]
MSTIDIKKLKKTRASLRGLLTKLENYITTNETIPQEEIQSRLQSLQETLRKLQEIQHDIETESPEEQLNEEIENRYDFEEKCTFLKTKLLILQNRNHVPTAAPQLSPSPSSTNSRLDRNPKMNFQPFQEKETFKNFTKRLTVYFLLNNIEDPKMKVYILLSALSPELHEKLHDLCSPEDPINMNFIELTRILDDHIDPKPSVWALQHKFITRVQKQDETVAMYASELKKLSNNCEFKCQSCHKPTLESFISLQFIRGLKDSDIRIRILQERETPPFTRLVQMATSMEMGKSENIRMSTDAHRYSDSLNRITNITNKNNFPNTPPSQIQNRRLPITIKELKGKCYRCGKNDHQSKECGALKSVCMKCNKTGHLARVCLQRNTNMNKLDDTTSNTSDENMGDINLMKSEISEKYMIPIKIENRPISMEFDTGATLSSISLKQYKKLNIGNRIFKTDMKLRTYTGEIIKPSGVTYVKYTYKDQTFNGKLYIINQDVDAIFGRSWMKELTIKLSDINIIRNSEPSTNLDQLLEEYTNTVFRTDLGKIPNYQAHLNLKENIQPIFIKPRRIPYALKEKVDEEIERLCSEGIITKVDHAEWGTPIVPIVKPNGTIRLCADYKVTLNKCIKDEQYPIPIIEDIFTEMNGGKYFCTLDIKQAYLNLEMDDESALLQTLSTHKGTYKVNRLMFGVKVAPSLWQKFMDQLLQGLDGVKCFFDDIIIQGTSEDQLLSRLKQVLQKLKESNLRVNREKCNFFKRSINYLGHIIDEDGLHKNKDKVKAIMKTERPKNVNELRTFLGMANYYNKFIPNLASITNPLNELLKKEKEFQWSSKCETSFNKIKQEILSERVLIHFDPKKPLIIATDASPTGLGVVLSHKLKDGSERPIAFASRSLSTSEKKYSQIDKEATAIFWGIKKFFHYCYGRKFTLITDHKPLTSIFHPHQTLPALSTMRLFHYAHFLSGFDYDVEYRPASKHSNADYLSRFPVEYVKENSKDQHYTFQQQQINTLDVRPELIAKETKTDEELKILLEALKTGHSVRQHGYNDNELTLQDNCILKGTRVVIPHSLRSRVLDELHAGHVGILKMKLLARSYIYWKNIDTDIENKVKSCRACRLQQNEPPKAPLHHWEQPTEPWQRLHIDFAGPVHGYQLLVVVDAFTKWVEIYPTKITTSSWCIAKLKELFTTYGIPHTLASDNGRQFISQEFEYYLSNCGIKHSKSAPYHPATNGQAERYIQTIKRALRAMEGERGDLNDKLLIIKTRLRRTPTSNGRTPYQLLFNRDVRTKLHVMFRTTPALAVAESNNRPPVKQIYTKGDRVQARNYSVCGPKWEFGNILNRLGRLHYEVQTDQGAVWRRHVEQLLPAPGIQK